MKKTLSVLAILALILLITPRGAFAKLPENVNKTVSVSARIGEFELNVRGMISPYASLSIVSGGNVYKSVSADSNGYFSFADILINRGFSDFCIDAIDWKRLGESYTCFSFPPAQSNITMSDVFLPPTLGINNKEVPEGSDVVISGYTMPESEVAVHVNNGQVLGIADATGYYNHRITKIKQGSYELYAEASYHGKPSLSPSKKVYLKAISLGAYWLSLLQNLITWLLSHIYLLVIPSLLLLIGIIALVIWHEPILEYLHLRQKKLHHAWFVGY